MIERLEVGFSKDTESKWEIPVKYNGQEKSPSRMCMKTRMLLGMAVILLTLASSASWAQDRYVPKDNEELFGRWKDDVTANAETVVDSLGFKTYYGSSNDVLLNEATQQIESKWTDAEGNIWYKVLGVYAGESPYVGKKFQALYKVYKSKAQLSLQLSLVIQYDPSNYPTESGPKADYVWNYHRVPK